MQISIELECVWLSSEEKRRFSNYCFISFKLLVFFSCRFRFDVRQQFFFHTHTHIHTYMARWFDTSNFNTKQSKNNAIHSPFRKMWHLNFFSYLKKIFFVIRWRCEYFSECCFALIHRDLEDNLVSLLHACTEICERVLYNANNRHHEICIFFNLLDFWQMEKSAEKWR